MSIESGSDFDDDCKIENVENNYYETIVPIIFVGILFFYFQYFLWSRGAKKS